jgi:hypothetical protein
MNPSESSDNHLYGHEHQSTSEAILAYLDSRWEQEQQKHPTPPESKPVVSLVARLLMFRERRIQWNAASEIELLNAAITAVEERDEALRRLREVHDDPKEYGLLEMIDGIKAAFLAASERARKPQISDWSALLVCGDAIRWDRDKLMWGAGACVVDLLRLVPHYGLGEAPTRVLLQLARYLEGKP